MLSVFSILPSSDTITPQILYSEAPAIHSGILTLNSAVNPILSEHMAPVAGTSIPPMQLAAYVAGILWLAGIAALLAYGIIAYIKLRGGIVDATRLGGIVYQSENVASPFLLGFIKPKIYVPYDMEEAKLSHVIHHENAHIKRRDHLLKLLASLILILHWFNPLVWIAFMLFCRDMELACDEKVIKGMSVDERKSYSEALLTLAIQGRQTPVSPLAFGETGIKARVKKALSYKKPAFCIILAALVACIITAVCLLSDPAKKAEPNKVNQANKVEALRGGDIAALYGTYHPVEVVYCNPLSSVYPYDLDQAPYYTFAENEFTMVTPGQDQATTNKAPLYTRSALTRDEFDGMFMMDLGKPDVSEHEAIDRIAITEAYDLYIVGTQLWLANHNDKHVWMIYELNPSQPYSPQAPRDRLTLDALISLVGEKGGALTWGDFAQYEHDDTGSGLYIWQLPVDENFCVLIGGGSLNIDPMYVKLIRLSLDGGMTSLDLDLLDKNANVEGFVNSFAMETTPSIWICELLKSSVFPALALDVDMRYSTVDVVVNSGSLYLHGEDKTEYLETTHTYRFAETIYWSPLTEDSSGSGAAPSWDIAASCTMRFSIRNGQGSVLAEGEILIEQIEQPGDGAYAYRVWMLQAEPMLHLAVNPDPNKPNRFVLAP